MVPAPATPAHHIVFTKAGTVTAPVAVMAAIMTPITVPIMPSIEVMGRIGKSAPADKRSAHHQTQYAHC
jgi:hypothetical protein